MKNAVSLFLIALISLPTLTMERQQPSNPKRSLEEEEIPEQGRRPTRWRSVEMEVPSSGVLMMQPENKGEQLKEVTREKRPVIILDTWENRTPYDLTFLKGELGMKGVKAFASLSSGKRSTLKWTIPLYDDREEYYWNLNERTAHIDISNSSDATMPYLKIWITYQPLTKNLIVNLNLVSRNLEGRRVDTAINAITIPLAKDNAQVFIQGTVEGDHLEKSRIAVWPVGESLKELSLQKIVRLVKDKIITYESARAMIPHDLHDELDKYLE